MERNFLGKFSLLAVIGYSFGLQAANFTPPQGLPSSPPVTSTPNFYYTALGFKAPGSGIPPAPSPSDAMIKKAYRQYALAYHPDKNPANVDLANQWFGAIDQAYKTLLSPEERSAYDSLGGIPTTVAQALSKAINTSITKGDVAGLQTAMNNLFSSGGDFYSGTIEYMSSSNGPLSYATISAKFGQNANAAFKVIAQSVYGVDPSTGITGDPLSTYLYTNNKLNDPNTVALASAINTYLGSDMTSDDLATLQTAYNSFIKAGGSLKASGIQDAFNSGPLSTGEIFNNYPDAVTPTADYGADTATANMTAFASIFGIAPAMAAAYGDAVVTDPVTTTIYNKLGFFMAQAIGPKINEALSNGDLVSAISIIQEYNDSFPDNDLSFLIVGPDAPLNTTNMQANYGQALIPTTEPGHDQTTISNNLNALATAIAGTKNSANIDPQLYTQTLSGLTSGTIQTTGEVTPGAAVTAANVYEHFMANFQAPAGTKAASNMLELFQQDPAAFKTAYSAGLWMANDMLQRGELLDENGDPISADDLDSADASVKANALQAFQNNLIKLTNILLESAGYVAEDAALPTYTQLQSALAPAGSEPTIPAEIPSYGPKFLSYSNIPNVGALLAVSDAAALIAGYSEYPTDDAAQELVESEMEAQMYDSATSGWYSEIDPVR